LWGAALILSHNAPRSWHPNKKPLKLFKDNVRLSHISWKAVVPQCTVLDLQLQNICLHSCCRFVWQHTSSTWQKTADAESWLMAARYYTVGLLVLNFWLKTLFTTRSTYVRGAVLLRESCLSVRLFVCNVGGLWSHRLGFFEDNFTVS